MLTNSKSDESCSTADEIELCAGACSVNEDEKVKISSMKLFGARKNTMRPEDKSLNQLIFDLAEHRQSVDIKEIYKRLNQLELFVPVLSANFELKDGQKMVIEKGMELNIARMQTEIEGLVFAAFLVNKDDRRLGDNFIGISVTEAFDMIEKTNDQSGLAFYNDRESYFGIVRQDFPMIRSLYLS